MKDKAKIAESTDAVAASGQPISRELQLEIIFNTSSDVIFLISIEADSRFRFTSVNQTFLAVTGLRKNQVEGKYVDEIIPEPSLTLVLSKYQEAISNRKTIRWEETTNYPAGTKTGIANITPVFNEYGVCIMLVGTVHDITERKKAEQEKEQANYWLNERVKELTTLYQASRIFQSASEDDESILQQFLSILPPGWQYPEFTEAQITIGEKKFHTPGFKLSVDKQSSEFSINEETKGKIEVGYTKTMPRDKEGPFLAEERKLIDMLSAMLSAWFIRKRAAGQLLKEKELSDSVINSLPGMVYLQEITGELCRWNKQFEVVTGYSGEEASKLHALDFFDEKDHDLILRKSMEIYKNGYADLEAAVVTKDRNKIPHYFSGQLIEYEGRPCIIGTGIDITERKKASEQLLKEKELSESIINSLPGIFYLFDSTGKYLRWNKNHETVSGYSTEEMQNMYPLNFFDEDEKEMIKKRIENVFIDGYAVAEANFMGKDGRKTPYYFNGISVEYEGQPCLMGVAFDLTARKKMELELREAEIKFRTLVEKSLVGVYIVQNGKFVYVNPRFAEIFGYAPEELINTDPVQKIVTPEYQALARENVRARLEGDLEVAHYEVTGIRKDGSMNRVEFYGSRTNYGGQPTIIGTMVDITERKLAEAALQESEANLHAIFDTTDTHYTLLNNNFQVVSFNQRSYDFVEKELHQRLSLSANLISYFPGDRQPELHEQMKRVLNGESINFESSYGQADGSTNWYYIRMFPIRNNEQKILGMMVAMSDITEKKLLEREIMNRKVQEQKTITRAVLNAQEKERNKIGQELHDNVNQILVGSKMYLGLLEKDITGKEELIKKTIGLLDNAINEIRSLTREQVTPQRRTDLKELIQSLVDIMNMHNTVNISFRCDTDLIEITDDLKLNIYRIVQEGMNNIIKHSAARNAVILVSVVSDAIYIRISDDGNGFDPELTKTKGIGLANILNRVESYNGTIDIAGNPGNGCAIEITFPV